MTQFFDLREQIERSLDRASNDAILALETDSALDLVQHAALRSVGCRAALSGCLTRTDAEIVNSILPGGFDTSNGGWDTSADLACKLAALELLLSTHPIRTA